MTGQVCDEQRSIRSSNRAVPGRCVEEKGGTHPVHPIGPGSESETLRTKVLEGGPAS